MSKVTWYCVLSYYHVLWIVLVLVIFSPSSLSFSLLKLVCFLGFFSSAVVSVNFTPVSMNKLFYITTCYYQSRQQRAGLLHRSVCERVTCCNLKTSPPLSSSPHSHLHIPLKTSHLRRMIYAHPHQALSPVRMRFRCAAPVSGWDSSPMALSVSCRNQVLRLLGLVMNSLQNGNKIFRMFHISLHRMHYLMLHVLWHVL